MRNRVLPLAVLAGFVSCSLFAADPVTEQFAKYDKNKDGVVTSAELPQPILFRLLDGNGDGKVTLEEAQENAPRILAATQSADMKPAAENPAESSKDAASKKSKKELVAVKKVTPSKTEEDDPKSRTPDQKGALEESPVRQGPRFIKASEHGVGRRIPDFNYTTLTGKSARISDCKEHKYTVFALTSTSCPLSKKYLPSLVSLSEKFGSFNIEFVLVNPFATDKPETMKAAADSFKAHVEYVHDKSNDLSRVLGASTTTDVIVLDSAQTVVYHGAVDDQYGFGYSLDKPRESYLRDALDALLRGERPRIAATDAPGCTLELAPTKSPKAEDAPTYYNQIARIVQQNCVECHRTGGVAPFTLTSYQDVVDHASMIKTVVEKKTMPPWFAVEKDQKQPTPWVNDRSLTDAEKKTLNSWLNTGKKEGDSKEAPAPFQSPGEWVIGTPDVIYQLPQPVDIKATGTMDYYDAVVETKLTEDKWVQALEVRPTAREVVHHVIVFAYPPNQKGGERQADERLGYFAVYVPGNSTLIYPDGFAKRLPKGTKLRFQMHYTPNGTETKDQTRVGFVFAKQPPEHEVLVTSLVNTWFKIPPGDANFQDSASIRLPTDIRVLGYLPHMHLRGKAARYELTDPEGKKSTLLDVPHYDFNWQLIYRYADPLLIKKGSRITYTSWFDNSDKNPANPNPKVTVSWGPQTQDEMLLGYMEYYYPDAKPSAKLDVAAMNLMSPSNPEYLFDMVDEDGDDKLSKDEIKLFEELSGRGKPNDQMLNFLLTGLDSNKDGMLDRKEFAKIKNLPRGNRRRN
ncbi:MAG: EF-hand domain-containing protein [Planctomycetales bacterium]